MKIYNTSPKERKLLLNFINQYNINKNNRKVLSPLVQTQDKRFKINLLQFNLSLFFTMLIPLIIIISNSILLKTHISSTSQKFFVSMIIFNIFVFFLSLYDLAVSIIFKNKIYKSCGIPSQLSNLWTIAARDWINIEKIKMHSIETENLCNAIPLSYEKES